MSSVSSLNSLLSSASTSSTSSSIDISSLLAAATGATSAGINVTSAVAAAVYAAQAPERQWQAQQSTITSQITALTSVQTSLTTLSGDIQNLNDLQGSLAARTVSSSNTNSVTATATSGASIGSHSVAISHLASAASWYSPAVAGTTSPLGAMQLNLVAENGTVSTFSTGGSGTNTLSGLASAINSSNLGITASVVNDSSGSRLALVSSTTGAASDFSVSYGVVSGSSWNSTSVASASTALGASSFQVGDGTQTQTISVPAGTTLSAVANQINNAGLDVTASVVTDASGAHLSLTSANSGPVAVTGDPAFSLARASQGTDASLTVDGIPITSASNTVSGAVNGITLNLLGTTTGAATLSVAADASTITGAISQFVTDYNSSLALVNTQYKYSSSSSSQGVLSGDSTTRSLQSALMGMMGYTGSSSGASSGNGTLSLASLGITMGDDGSLSVNASKLSQVVASNPTSVQNFFQGSALNGFAASFAKTLKTYADPANGALTLEIRNLNQSYTSLQSEVDNYESGYIASQKTVLTAMYSQAEIALQSLPTTLKQLQSELGQNSGS